MIVSVVSTLTAASSSSCSVACYGINENKILWNALTVFTFIFLKTCGLWGLSYTHLWIMTKDGIGKAWQWLFPDGLKKVSNAYHMSQLAVQLMGGSTNLEELFPEWRRQETHTEICKETTWKVAT